MRPSHAQSLRRGVTRIAVMIPRRLSYSLLIRLCVPHTDKRLTTKRNRTKVRSTARLTPRDRMSSNTPLFGPFYCRRNRRFP